MPMDEFRSRSEARGAGALIGAGAVVTGRLAIALTPVAAKFAAKLGGPPKINEAQQKNLARFEKEF